MVSVYPSLQFSRCLYFILRLLRFFQAQKNARLQRNGAELSLRSIAKHFKQKLPEKIPELWDIMIGALERNLHNVPGTCIYQEPGVSLILG